MEKRNVVNLIKYHYDKDERSFKNEAKIIARYFDSIGDEDICDYILSLITELQVFVPQDVQFDTDFINYVDTKKLEPLNLPYPIFEDIKGILNAINHNVGVNRFLFQGLPGTGKTEAAKNIARMLERSLFIVNFESLIDSKLGQTNKNITELFKDINWIANHDNAIILFDEIDAIALDRINSNDVREMGRATSTILKELDKLNYINKNVIVIATTNLYENMDKALTRRFDAVIDFNRYQKEDLIEVAQNCLSLFIKNFKNTTKDIRLFKKILNLANELPNPGELKNIIRTSLAFSDLDDEFNYLKRLYNSLIGNLDDKTIDELYQQGFTIREIEKLKNQSKSSVARKLNKEVMDNE
ncbi:AAA family ATPase [Mycoplasma sp. NEAQ87857]|uniref:ATP-binding protein n=1 Tax=Mycoplasma sp. NEAQ87857 TaxID=2683967 RepID=UPI0013197CB3|nr:ATP-binding protein [Mycoplasma sp. NEAQ87857]QGZ97901.1 AAA family ATPase [Mycoplasma sp. NEAQ87857]